MVDLSSSRTVSLPEKNICGLSVHPSNLAFREESLGNPRILPESLAAWDRFSRLFFCEATELPTVAPNKVITPLTHFPLLKSISPENVLAKTIFISNLCGLCDGGA